MSESLKSKALSGVIWSAVDRFSVQGVQFVVMIIMARLLTPSDYGLIGMLAVFIAVAQSLIDSGFSSALIRKTDRSETDFSTVFYFNIIVGILLFLILFFSAGWLASFYETPALEAVTKVISINLFINSLAVVQRALFSIQLDFKSQTKASLSAALISGFVGILLAYKGFGVWSLVFLTILNNTIVTILFWILSKWKPRKEFSYASFKDMFSYGSRILMSGIIDTLYRNIFTLVIGKKFSAQILGYYTRADQFAQFPSSNLTGIMQRVTFPVLSRIQDDNIRLRLAYRKFLRLSAYIIFPLMLGVAALSNPFVIILLTEKWSFTIILLQILCFSYMWYPVHAINLNLLQVKGYSSLFLRLELIKKVIGVSILFITIPLGVKAMCLGSVLSSLIALVINTYYTGKIINMGFFKQMRDLMPSMLYSLSMGILVWFVSSRFQEPLIQLIIGTIVGVIYYFGISYITRSQELKELVLLIKEKRNG